MRGTIHSVHPVTRRKRRAGSLICFYYHCASQSIRFIGRRDLCSREIKKKCERTDQKKELLTISHVLIVAAKLAGNGKEGGMNFSSSKCLWICVSVFMSRAVLIHICMAITFDFSFSSGRFLKQLLLNDR
jgi:hypothetical protein